ncbi:MAG: protein-L-isoaspartate(D-aspartate) O-methyltransferase [Rhabdochlamydiaceae bacterium]
MEGFKEQRRKMVAEQIAARGVQDPRVLEVMEKVPREMFVDPFAVPFAYKDTPLPIKEEQTISQPFIVAWMVEQAQLNPQDKVLEVGTGSGYSTAILSQLTSHVYSIERFPTLAQLAEERLQQLGYTNISILVGDGTVGWNDFSPYDAIIVTAGGPQVPPSLLKQLKIGGRLIIPVGPNLDDQQLVHVVREDKDNYRYKNIGAVRFVPLLGQEGWKE